MCLLKEKKALNYLKCFVPNHKILYLMYLTMKNVFIRIGLLILFVPFHSTTLTMGPGNYVKSE